ncbi:uncharacterized protein LTR77_000957 [Saxophila tyrrhenica]|uniref:Uncharacterized protein n=1 Tax=Saxophila tyrrhenica TaxID=1690608 RepID=A0AAV9PPT6_9PEZI|nr:hypothetical protein LTR77_000957 [Saxophila tyrrhenica]
MSQQPSIDLTGIAIVIKMDGGVKINGPTYALADLQSIDHLPQLLQRHLGVDDSSNKVVLKTSEDETINTDLNGLRYLFQRGHSEGERRAAALLPPDQQLCACQIDGRRLPVLVVHTVSDGTSSKEEQTALSTAAAAAGPAPQLSAQPKPHAAPFQNTGSLQADAALETKPDEKYKSLPVTRGGSKGVRDEGGDPSWGDADGTLGIASAGKRKKSKARKRVFFRVGLCADDDDGLSEDAPEISDNKVHSVIVAEVSSPDTDVSYLSVDTFFFNGLSIGSCDAGVPIENFAPGGKYRLDKDFVRAGCTSKGDLNGVVQELSQSASHEGALFQTHLIRPRALPVPSKRSKAAAVWKSKGSTSKATIAGLLFFCDTTEPRVLVNVPGVQEITLKDNHTLPALREHLRDQVMVRDEERADGEMTLDSYLHKKLEPEFIYSVWILPQVEGSEKLWCWDTRPKRQANSWLDSALERRPYNPRVLYIEVVISGKAKTENNGDQVEETSQSDVESGSVDEDGAASSVAPEQDEQDEQDELLENDGKADDEAPPASEREKRRADASITPKRTTQKAKREVSDDDDDDEVV